MSGTKAISSKKQSERDALLKSTAIFKEGEVTETSINEFISVDASTIVKNIQNRVPGWTSTAVLTAYIRRAIVAQKEVNCITEGELISKRQRATWADPSLRSIL